MIFCLIALLAAGAVGTPTAEFRSFDAGSPMFLGCNYWASHAGVRMWSDWRPQEVEKDLDAMAAHGMKVLRVFPLWPDFQPLTADFGGGQCFVGYSQGGGPLQNEAGVDEEMMARFRFLCDAAQKRGIRLVVGLITGWMSGRTFVPPALERMRVLEDPEAIRWEVRFVRHFVRAFRDHRAILAWDLGNECNCLGASGEAAQWAWMHQITAEIRLNDPTRPVVSGMHSCLTRRMATTNLRQQGELTDVLTTHPYPLWTPNCNREPFDTIRNGCHAACETTLYANLARRPAFVEEAGSMGPQIVSEDRAAASMRMALFNCWACGIPGFLWWCGFDQDRLAHAPYDWTAIERELGLFTAERRAKPTAVEMKAFRAFLDGLPFKELPPRQVDATVVLSETEDAWPAAQGAWLLAKQAGFDIAYARAEDKLPDASFYILPSGNGYNTYTRTAFWRVMEKAEAGATVLITLGNGAILSNLEKVAGVRTENHYCAATRRTMAFPKGTFEIPDSHTRTISTADGVKVLARDSEGCPAMTEFGYGKGKVLFFAGALEKNADLAGWPAYALAAERAGVRRAVRREASSVCVTEHPRADGSRVVVAVNCEPKPVRCAVSLDGSVGRVHRGRVAQGVMEIGANDAAVFELSRP